MPSISFALPPEEDPIRCHTWKWFAGCALALGALIWWIRHTLAQQGFDWGLMMDTLAHARLGWILFSWVAIYAAYFGRALRWAVFLKPLKPAPSMRNLMVATIVGFTAINLLGRPGEVVRPYLIASKEEVPITSQLAAWVLERIFDLLMALVIFGFALTQVKTSGAAVGRQLAWVLTMGGRIVGLTCGGLLLMLMGFRHFAEPTLRWLTKSLHFLPGRQFAKIQQLIGAFVQGMESTRSDSALFWVLVYSILEWALILLWYRSVAFAFTGFNLTNVDVLIFMAFVNFGVVIQIPGIGGGLQVVAVLVLTELFKIRFELATAFALLIWITTFIVTVPIGLLVAFREGLDWRKWRRIGREAAV
jgi:glycosyltransferase 2 family protein